MASFDPTNQQHVVTVSGRKFITFVGLQARLSDQGKRLVGAHTEILQNGDDHESGRWLMRATLKIYHEDTQTTAEIQGIGDASKENVGKMIHPHLPRMAETRAEVRALRKATRSEYTAAEELGG